MKKINILMTGAGAPGAAGIINCILQDPSINLFVGDADTDPSGKHITQNYINLLPADDEKFIDNLLSLCIQYSINLIFPLVTKELFKLSQHIDLFKNNSINIIVSNYESLQVANNKSALYRHLDNVGIDTPQFKVIDEYSQLKSAFESLGYPANPLCIKPSLSNGSRGVRVIDERINKFDLLFNYKPTSLYMSYSELDDILSKNIFPQLLLSEYLPGAEITIDTIMHADVMHLWLARTRDKMQGGISVKGQFFYDEGLYNYTKKVLTSLRLDGPIGLQMKQDKNGRYKILEINPRIQGTSVSAMGLQINIPLLVIYQKLGLPVDIPDLANINWGIKFVRVYREIYYNE